MGGPGRNTTVDNDRASYGTGSAAERGKCCREGACPPIVCLMPLVSGIIAILIGFLFPWRFGIELAGRTNWVSAADAAIAITLTISAIMAPRRVLTCLGRAAKQETAPPLAVILGLAIHHALTTPAAAGGGAVPALAIAWAIVAGVTLCHVDRTSLLCGLRVGTWSSGLLALLLLASHPGLVLEHNYFAGLAGAKNTFAFFVAASTLAAVESAVRRREEGRALVAIEMSAGLALLALANARAAAIALGAALLVIPGGGRRTGLLRGLLAIAATVFAAGATVPEDRIQFAWSILAHADGIPLLGLGPGFGYGLDTALKTLLELGPAGFAALAALALFALRRGGLSPWFILIAVFALAHDLARWPLFWLFLLNCQTGAFRDIVSGPTVRNP